MCSKFMEIVCYAIGRETRQTGKKCRARINAMRQSETPTYRRLGSIKNITRNLNKGSNFFSYINKQGGKKYYSGLYYTKDKKQTNYSWDLFSLLFGILVEDM